MARLKNYTRSLASGYALMAVNIAYSLAMIPLALSYLDKPVFGIWAVVVQVGVFLQLTDLGMTGAFARILIEHKDASDRSQYASVIKTMWMVFCLQGLVIAALGWVAAPLISDAFKIDAELQLLFADFMRVYLVIFGLSISLKIFELTLSAHQRNDLVNVNSMLGFAAGFLGLWLGFHAGWGLWAMAAGYAAMMLINAALAFWQAKRTGLLPSGLMTVRFSRARFLEVFDYGKDRFLVTAGSSVLQAAPTFLVTRFLGLEASAAWMVGTRALYLCVQLVARFSDFAYPAFAEMYVRGEMARLKDRFVSLVEVAVLAAGAFGVLLTFLNSDFVTVLARGRIVWDSRLDVLLGVWLVAMVIQRVFWLPVGVSMALGFMRFVYFAEALLMLTVVAGLLLWRDSLSGVVFGILVSSLLVSIPYSIRRSGQILNCSAFDFMRRPAITFLTVITPLALVGYGMSYLNWPQGLAGLVIRGFLLSLLGAGLLFVLPNFRLLAKEILLKSGRKS